MLYQDEDGTANRAGQDGAYPRVLRRQDGTTHCIWKVDPISISGGRIRGLCVLGTLGAGHMVEIVPRQGLAKIGEGQTQVVRHGLRREIEHLCRLSVRETMMAHQQEHLTPPGWKVIDRAGDDSAESSCLELLFRR